LLRYCLIILILFAFSGLLLALSSVPSPGDLILNLLFYAIVFFPLGQILDLEAVHCASPIWLWRQKKTLKTEFETVITREMIETTSEYGSMRLCLPAFHKYKIQEDAIVLYESWGTFHVIPRRSFPSEQDYETFLFYLDANVIGSFKPYTKLFEP
jgi:YcxB-like protein